MSFSLHPQLAADCLVLGDTPLCRLLLMNDAQYPWCILVPRRADIREIYELNGADRRQLMEESTTLSGVLMRLFSGDKLNLAALGNVVPQLHLHHVVRRRDDPSWPAPVWGRHPARPYTVQQKDECIARISAALPLWLGADAKVKP